MTDTDDEPTPKQVKALAKAKLFFPIGVHFETGAADSSVLRGAHHLRMEHAGQISAQ